MPSKSRKKIKGQARKAKAKSDAALVIINSDRQNQWNVIDNRGRIGAFELTPKSNTIFCDHGGLLYNMPTVCVQFITTFYTSVIQSANAAEASAALQHANNEYPNATLRGINALVLAYNECAAACTNQYCRNIVKKNLIRNGVSSLLPGNGPKHLQMAVSCAAALMTIDSYDPSSPTPGGNIDERNTKKYLTTLDIISGCHHSLVKFYVNQIPCKCLDAVYSQDKANRPKSSACSNCKMRGERRDMFICTGCERIIYCSKACQLKHVPIHKERCIVWQNGGYTYS